MAVTQQPRSGLHSLVRDFAVRVADIGLWVTATVGLTAAVASAVMFSLGVRPLVVTSGSMEPNYPVRSMTLVGRVDASSVVKGDVVAVQLPTGVRVLHRVIDAHDSEDGTKRVVTLKGDANEKPDSTPVVLDDRAYRAVACIPYVGRVASWLRTPAAGFCAALVLLGPLALRRRRSPAPERFGRAHAGTPA